MHMVDGMINSGIPLLASMYVMNALGRWVQAVCKRRRALQLGLGVGLGHFLLILTRHVLHDVFHPNTASRQYVC